mmetsp:Transcript_11734/g.28824  ORF Transcript_11734/g.28824 Transcript_11734/m.28824 type:complete len:280 (+) Transcript_11734:519-1358(+)
MTMGSASMSFTESSSSSSSSYVVGEGTNSSVEVDSWYVEFVTLDRPPLEFPDIDLHSEFSFRLLFFTLRGRERLRLPRVLREGGEHSLRAEVGFFLPPPPPDDFLPSPRTPDISRPRESHTFPALRAARAEDAESVGAGFLKGSWEELRLWPPLAVCPDSSSIMTDTLLSVRLVLDSFGRRPSSIVLVLRTTMAVVDARRPPALLPRFLSAWELPLGGGSSAATGSFELLLLVLDLLLLLSTVTSVGMIARDDGGAPGARGRSTPSSSGWVRTCSDLAV